LRNRSVKKIKTFMAMQRLKRRHDTWLGKLLKPIRNNWQSLIVLSIFIGLLILAIHIVWKRSEYDPTKRDTVFCEAEVAEFLIR